MRDNRRDAWLYRDPETGPVDMPALVGIADAIERESARRYADMAEAMIARREFATAAAFRAMHVEECRHLESVGHWADTLGEPIPPSESFVRQLPAELDAAWDANADSALLTPYRAFAIAAENEMRAFTFYSYLAAHATDHRVRREAEKLAREELNHASLMRQWRRRAWHRARRESAAAPFDATPIDEVADLERLLARSDTTIRRCHRAVAARLHAIGATAEADAIAALADVPLQAGVRMRDAAGLRPAAADTTADGAQGTDDGDDTDVPEADAIAAADSVPPLLVIAQRPLEALAERLEAVLATSQDELFRAAAVAVDAVVARLARLALDTAKPAR